MGRMKGIYQLAPRKFFMASLLCAVVLTCASVLTVSADSLSLPSILTTEPLSLMEKAVGPIFPPGGIASTFRSEFGGGFEASSLAASYLTSEEGYELDLRKVMPLERGSNRYSLYGNLRIWRFGLRAAYWNFDNRSKAKNQGKFDLTGGGVGADFDVVQFEHLALGVAADYYFIEPRLEGRFVLSPDDPAGFNVILTGDYPRTLGPYLRFVPVEILGFPMHVEAFWKIPISSTKLMSYGFALCFRPQMYRFDASIKLGLKKVHCKYKAEPTIFTSSVRSEKWTLDNEWTLFSAEMALYF